MNICLRAGKEGNEALSSDTVLTVFCLKYLKKRGRARVGRDREERLLRERI